MRKVIPALVILGLALGAWLLWPRDADVLTTTVPEAGATSSTTSTQATSTTSTDDPTTSTDGDSHVVETVAEAEEILRQLWFGWFEGIYNEDVERIREVVGTDAFLDAGLAAMGTIAFIEPPTKDGLTFSEIEILTSNADCLVVWTVTTPGFLNTSEPRSGVEVLRWVEDGWRFASAWKLREDLWQADCDAELPPLS